LFDALAMALAGGAVDRDQLLQESGANLPDGARVRRGEASFVISSLADEGVLAREDAARLGAERLAEHFRDIVLRAVANTQRSIDENEHQMLEEWLIGEENADASAFGDGVAENVSPKAVVSDEVDDYSDGDEADDQAADDDLEFEARAQRLGGDGDKGDGTDEPPQSDEAPRDGLRLPWDRRWRNR